eukprot:TRINITY_DN17756_c0_g1_i1.p1 TRINITY_DN17756_c0_g1~~TRINITY_DN17756_c0_g1_i1.p1  ORF type:complete len:167 (+),score=34.50 TRINITY_DN17756_c0_g1_i1:40-540(+)
MGIFDKIGKIATSVFNKVGGTALGVIKAGSKYTRDLADKLGDITQQATGGISWVRGKINKTPLKMFLDKPIPQIGMSANKLSQETINTMDSSAKALDWVERSADKLHEISKKDKKVSKALKDVFKTEERIEKTIKKGMNEVDMARKYLPVVKKTHVLAKALLKHAK